jgi:hypothetical protein
MKNWPAWTGSRCRPRPPIRTVTTSGLSRMTEVTVIPWRSVRHNGRPTRNSRIAPAAMA